MRTDALDEEISPAVECVDERVLERSDDVLWSIAPPGIMLHHLGSQRYLELDALGYSLWGWLDGARSVDEAINSALSSTGEEAAAEARTIIGILDAHGFLVSRS